MGPARAPCSGRPSPLARHAAPRPRVALFSPFPPKASGISDYVLRLLHELKRHYTVDLFHESGYVPNVGLGSAEFACYDDRLFDRVARAAHYRGVLYQMGNAPCHRTIYETLTRHPGVVMLHDFSLADFHRWYAKQPGVPQNWLRREQKFDRPRPGVEPPPFPYLNRRIFDRSRAVVVHSAWCREQVRRLFPEYLDRTFIIPFGAHVETPSPERRKALRSKYDIPQDALILANFGAVHPTKMNVESLAAFAVLARRNPTALFLVVGPEDWDGGAARRQVSELGLRGRVRFFGQQLNPEFLELVSITDIGIALRRLPTNGEVSGSLMDLLRFGVATIVIDIESFGDFPGHVVRKVRWECDGLEGLSRAVLELAEDDRARLRLGWSARQYLQEHHSWARSAALHAELIECEGSHPLSA